MADNDSAQVALTDRMMIRATRNSVEDVVDCRMWVGVGDFEGSL